MKKLLIGIMALFFLVGCAGVDIKITETQKENVAFVAGYNAAFWPLKNNPGYIRDVGGAVTRALDRAYTQGVDVALLIDDMLFYMSQLRSMEDFLEYAPAISAVVQTFRGMVIVDIDFSVPQERDMALRYAQAFLSGAQQAIYDLKG